MAHSRPKIRYKSPPPIRRGRKAGEVPFLKDKKRFEAIFWAYLQNACGFGPQEAAEICVGLLHYDKPMVVTDHSEVGAQNLSIPFNMQERRPEYLRREFSALFLKAVADADAIRWTYDSIRALHRFMDALNACRFDPAATAELERLGWTSFLSIFVRINSAFPDDKRRAIDLRPAMQRFRQMRESRKLRSLSALEPTIVFGMTSPLTSP